MNRASGADAAGVRVRDAVEADAPEVSLLLEELGYPTTPLDARERVRRTLADPSSHLLVATSGSDVLGLASAYRAPYFPDGSRVLRVTALVVRGGARGRGVGSALLARLADRARAQGCAGIEVTTGEARSDAHAFYQRLGFLRTSLRFFRALDAGSRAAAGPG